MYLFDRSSRKRFLSKKDSGATTYFEIRNGLLLPFADVVKDKR